MTRSAGAILLLSLFSVGPGAEGNSQPVSGARGVAAQVAAPEPPPTEIPSSSAPPERPPAFLAGKNLFDLPEDRFLFLLFDTPKALLVESQATLLAVDDSFYYCHDGRFDGEWAFSKTPQDHFARHAVWHRNRGDTEWKLRHHDAVLAHLMADDPADE